MNAGESQAKLLTLHRLTTYRPIPKESILLSWKHGRLPSPENLVMSISGTQRYSSRRADHAFEGTALEDVNCPEMGGSI